MPVYNAEEYLEKAVDSIINQTLSFKDNDGDTFNR